MCVLRYVLLQVPGFLLVLALLWIAWSNEWISAFTFFLVILILIFKDVLLYPFYKSALQPGPTDMASKLHGAEALVRLPLDPVGQIYIRGEIWKARSVGDVPIPSGTRVVVTDHNGLTLQVRPVRDEPDQY